MNAPVVTFEVAKRFAVLRRRLIATCIGITTASAVTALMVIWIALAAGDYAWEWPAVVRRSGLAVGLVGVFAWFAWRLYAILRACRRRQLVGRLERSYEDFGQRVRTVLDSVDGRVTAPGEMLAALGHQTLGRWETLGPLRLVPRRALAATSASCLTVLVVASGLFAVGDDWRKAMLRAVGSTSPYTALAVAPGNTRLLEGSSVEVSLELRGRTGRTVVLRYREVPEPPPSGETLADEAVPWNESELLPPGSSGGASSDGASIDPRHAVFAASLGRATEPIEYQFVTSAGSTPVFRIDVQPLIESQGIEALVQPPEYTGLEPRTFASADVTVLEQSEVTVTIQTNHPLAQATLQVGESRSSLQPAAITPSEDATRWSFQLPTLASLRWHFSGEGRDGTPMTPVKGRLRVKRDRAPRLSWRDPPDEIRVHTLAELPMQIQVSDDYGIAESGIAFQLGSEEYVLTDWTADDAQDQSTSTTRLRLEKTLPLESFGLSERDFIAYYAYAVDNRGWGPQRIESDIRYIDLRPLRQFYSESDLEPNAGGGGGVLVELAEIIRRQRFLINQTRKLVRSPSVELSTRLGRIDRMVENQSELASLTRFLAEFMVSRGNDDVEALSQAEAAMLQAADSLAAGAFDLALVHEEDSLRALAEARRTLEIVLRKNMTPAAQRALQQFAKQLRQKLRRERPETEREIVDTLQRLAVEQARLGQTAARLERKQAAPTAAGGGANPPSEPTEPTEPTASPASPASPESITPTEPTPDEADDPPTLEEEQDALFASQLDLLDRLQAIEQQLTDRLDQSPLMAQRIDDAKQAMDQLAKQARDGSLGAFPVASDDAADQLRELGMQLNAIASLEPVSRISAIRDMTASLVQMETEFADQLRGAASNSTDADDSPVAAAPSRMARRMERRAKTIEDVLKTPTDIGDLEASEVTANLERFIEETGFLEQLAETVQAASSIPEAPGDSGSGDEQAYRRAAEYADAARRLDELYRQLVTPRLARLRQIEQQAGELAQQMGKGKGAEESVETKAGMGKLESDLKEEGLGELAEVLSPEAMIDDPPEDSSGGDFGPAGGFDPTDSPTRQRVIWVGRELRARIQEMILLEIAADREAPVPAQYRAAVDRYFGAIAGGADAAEDQGR